MEGMGGVLRDASGRFVRKPRRDSFNLTGQTFGRLKVVRFAGYDVQFDRSQSHNRRIRRLWKCRCECGKTLLVQTNSLKTGNTTSCGCLKRDLAIALCKSRATHGHTRIIGGKQVLTPTFISWMSMIARCLKPYSRSFKDYGAKGIKVCKRWLKFENFLADLGPRPHGRTLGRQSDMGDYKPSNVSWQTRAQQGAERRRHGQHQRSR